MLTIIALCGALLGAAAAPTTLVLRNQDGTFLPGVASAWETTPRGVRLTLGADVDLEALITLLAVRLPTVNVAVASRTIELTGVASAALLEQLATVRMAGGQWSVLSDLGTTKSPTMQHPSAGGSIRASHPNRPEWSTSQGPGRGATIAADSDPDQRLLGRVISLSRGEFPRVRLELEVIEAAASNDFPAPPPGKTVTAQVAFVHSGGKVDLEAAGTQNNLGAYFLNPGDRVRAHLSPTLHEWSIDFIERAPAAEHP